MRQQGAQPVLDSFGKTHLVSPCTGSVSCFRLLITAETTSLNASLTCVLSFEEVSKCGSFKLFVIDSPEFFSTLRSASLSHFVPTSTLSTVSLPYRSISLHHSH